MKQIRFATQTGGAPTAEEWFARAKRIEALGYDTLAMPDHMVGGAWAAMPALAALATVTTKLRFGTLVIDNDFRNPVVFAREVAVVDVLTGGRFELGMGAGWFDRDYLGTGIAFDRGRVRVARLAEAITLMKRLFTEEQVDFTGTYYKVEKAECRPKTIQQPHPPLMIAGGGEEILTLAGREADIVAIVPAGITGSGKLANDAVTLDTMKRQAELVRDAAGTRADALELSMFLDCVITDDRAKTIAEMAEKAKADPAIIEGSAYRGIGTVEEITAHVRKLRQEVGVTYFCLRGPDVENLGPVVSALAGK
ncbi:MAG TPA: TIGR03621 family F420-dependent LLM class oxidoreductase [Candidatus Limnocylindrales bacterium]|nr:TIGR03621 family F420-dependent LLM class oxidoreductase [Candidatus Limnocylindrales bacterium]